MSDPEFRTVFSSVRPQRVVTFVDSADGDWRETCLRIVEFYSRIWGGNYNLIVPTDGQTISPIFWNLLELYDPDYLFEYRKTGADLKISKPTEYAAHVDRETRAWVEQHVPLEDWTQRRPEFDERLARARFSGFEVCNDLQNQLRDRLAPFFHGRFVVQSGALTARDDPRYPLTAIKDILPNCDHPRYVLGFGIDDRRVPPLWAASALGQTSPGFDKEVQAAEVFFNSSTITTENVESLIAQVIAGHGLTDPDTVTVAALAGIKLNRYRRFRRGEPDNEPAMVLVAGESIEDFCLYHSLSRIRGRVYWLQTDWIETYRNAKLRSDAGGAPIAGDETHGYYLANQLFRLADEGDPTNIPLISVSLSLDQLGGLADALDVSTLQPGLLRPRLIPTLELAEALREPYRAYEIENSRDVTKHVVNGQMVGLYETPKPRHFDPVVPEHRWITELSISEYRVPRHSLLGRLFIRDHRLSSDDARAGLTGLSYACPNSGYRVGAEVDSILIRPALTVPPVLEVFQFLADKAGLRCEISVKGVYELEALTKFAGLGELASAFRSEKENSVLRKFVDSAPAIPDVHNEGVFLRPDSQRYLDFSAFKKLLGNEAETVKLVDRYVLAGIVYRGLILKCAFCRSTDWFNLADVDQSFQCKRCSRAQLIQSHHQVRAGGEPQWFYKLDQLILRGLQNNMHVPVLTLDWIRRHSRDSFVAAADMDFFEGVAEEPFIESDICCLSDESIVLGEAKTTDRLGQNAAKERSAIEKYLGVAERLGARRVVFATGASEWAPACVNQIKAVFENKPLKIDILNRADLIS